MRFQVPQFIEIEDKIFGPFTIKQFVYIAGGAGLCFLILRLLNFYIAIFLAIPVAALAIALAFFKINNKPFVFTLEAAVKYTLGTKLYIWKKEPKKLEVREGKEKGPDMVSFNVPKLSESKLKELTW